MFRQFVRIGGIWGYGGIGRRRTFIALLEWKALMVDRFERKPTRKMNKSYRAGSNPVIPTMITNLKLQIIAVRLELGYSLSDKQKEVWDKANDGDKEKACLTIKNKVYE